MDSGNFSDNPTPSGESKTRSLVQGMERLGYQVINVGDRDLNRGYDTFKARTAGVKIPFVSSNIVRQDNGNPVFNPYTIVEAKSKSGNKIKVGVIGASRYNPLFLKSGPGDSKLVIKKAEDTVPEYVKSLQGKVDVIVLLAALHKTEAQRIVQAAPGIDFVISNYGGIVTAQQEKVGKTELLYSGNQGKRVGETRVYFADGSKTVQSTRTTMHMLTARYPHDEAMLRFVNAELKKAKLATPAGATGSPTQ